MNKKLSLLSVGALLLSVSGMASAQIVVSQQFALFNDHDLGVNDVAGVVPAANFNVSPDAGNGSDTHAVQQISASSLNGDNLTTSTFVSTGIGYNLTFDATFQSSSSIAGANFSNNNKLLFGPHFNRFSDDSPSPITSATLNVTGLNTTDSYSLYVYYNAAFSNSGVSSSIALNGGTPFTITNNTSLTSFTQSTATSAVGNYVEFTGLTGSTAESVSIATGTVGFTGFQLVDNGIVAAPEPSTWALMVAGLAFLGLGLRRKSALLS